MLVGKNSIITHGKISANANAKSYYKNTEEFFDDSGPEFLYMERSLADRDSNQ